MLSPDELDRLWSLAVRDDAWQTIVPSDIRALISQCRDLNGALKNEKVVAEIVQRNQNEIIREKSEALRKANEALRTARKVIEHYRRGKHEKTFGPAAHWLVTHPAPANPSEGETR